MRNIIWRVFWYRGEMYVLTKNNAMRAMLEKANTELAALGL